MTRFVLDIREVNFFFTVLLDCWYMVLRIIDRDFVLIMCGKIDGLFSDSIDIYIFC